MYQDSALYIVYIELNIIPHIHSVFGFAQSDLLRKGTTFAPCHQGLTSFS